MLQDLLKISVTITNAENSRRATIYGTLLVQKAMHWRVIAKSALLLLNV